MRLSRLIPSFFVLLTINSYCSLAFLVPTALSCFGFEILSFVGEEYRGQYQSNGRQYRQHQSMQHSDKPVLIPVRIDACIMGSVGLVLVGLGLLPRFISGPPVIGGWSSFGPFGSCTAVICGTFGQVVRTRTCTNPRPLNNGAACPGSNIDTQICSAPCPVNGGWTNWGAFGACSASCGLGIQTRIRACTNPLPSNGGAQCIGSDTDAQICSASCLS